MVKDLDLVIKVSRLYYEKDLNFTQIGKLLKLSRFQVSNIIKEAKKIGIVKIIIDERFVNENAKLEESLEKNFDINRAIVVDNRNLPKDKIRNKVGYSASKFLIDILKDNDIISFTTSSTVNAILDSISNKNKIKNVKIVEANGGSNITYSNSAHEISRKFSEIFGAKHYSINAPIIVDSEDAKNNFLKQKNIKRTIELFEEISVLIFGIGSFYPKLNELMIKSGDLDKEEFLELKKLKSVGNILYYYYDIDGNFLKPSFDNRIICFPREKIKEVPYTIAVVYGNNKKYGLLGALRTGLVKFLIMDSQLAKAVLEIKDISSKEFEKLYRKDIKFNNYINNI